MFRNNLCPTETPTSKLVKRTNFDEKTPIAGDAKLRRRQSLTTIETLGSSVSRRTSIGGKSIDSSEWKSKSFFFLYISISINAKYSHASDKYKYFTNTIVFLSVIYEFMHSTLKNT